MSDNERCPTCDRPPGTGDPDWQCLRDKYDAAVAERDRLRSFVETVARFSVEPHRIEVAVQELIDDAKRLLRGKV